MITRENYEEFFLLYADDELPAETRLAVERFVDAHPDLREEWETLQQCRLEPESDQTFPDKNSLLRYEETFLAYVDGELDEQGRKTVETLVGQDAEKARELQYLMMTVSRPDAEIIFPDKESLYRTEKRRRVVMMPWLKVGAAAAVLTVVALSILHRRTNVPAVMATTPVASVTHAPAAVTATASSTPADSAPADSAPADSAPADSAAADSAAADSGPAKIAPPAVTSAVATTLHPITNAVAVRQEDRKKPKTARQTITPAPAPVIAQTAKGADTSDRSSKLLAVVPVHPDKATLPVTTAVAVNIPRDQSSFATQALLREAQEDGSGDVTDNMQQPAGKTRLRGLFRKVTRAFSKTADREDDGQRQVLISAFQVALK